MPDTVSVVSLVMKSLDDVPVSVAIAVIVDRRRRQRRIDGDGLAVVVPTLPAASTIRAVIGEAGAVRVGGIVIAPAGAGACVTSSQLAPPSLLTWIFSPATSAPLVPDTDQRGVAGDEVARDVPVSVTIAVIADRRRRRAVSMVTAWLW